METAIVKSAHRNETSYEDVTEEIVDPETRALEKGSCSHIGKVFLLFSLGYCSRKSVGKPGVAQDLLLRFSHIR